MREDIAVTIFGRHSQSWRRALYPGANVWSMLNEVRSVRVVEPSTESALPGPDEENGRPVLIPLMEVHIRSRPRGYFTACPNDHALDTLADKARFATYVEEQGFGDLCPKVYDTVETATFPVLAKPRTLNAGIGIRLLHDRAQYEEFRASPAWDTSSYILQRYVEDDQDYATYLFCSNGRVIWHRTFRYALPPGSPIRGQMTGLACELCMLTDEQISAFERLLVPLSYSGPCNVDHKVAPDGSVLVLEINPRLGGSLMRPDNIEYLASTMRLIFANAEKEGLDCDQ